MFATPMSILLSEIICHGNYFATLFKIRFGKLCTPMIRVSVVLDVMAIFTVNFLTTLINWLHKRLNNVNNTNRNITTFLELLIHLSLHQVKYILVGGLAVDFCGYSRATHDVDIIIEYSETNINLLLSCLSRFGQGSAKELSYEDFLDLKEGYIRIVEHYPLDIFTVMRGNIYQDLLTSICRNRQHSRHGDSLFKR
jgi:hypothetical protein